MNPITLTSDLERLAVLCRGASLPLSVAKKDADSIAGLPLLTMDFGHEDVVKIAEEYINDTTPSADDIFRTPFPQFRFHAITKWATVYGIVSRPNPGDSLTSLVVFSDSGRYFISRTGKKVVIKTVLTPSRTPGMLEWRSKCFEHETGNELCASFGPKANYDTLPGEIREAMEFASNLAIVAIEALSSVYLIPSNRIAVVRPDQPGRSVEWIKAREHLTVIHRHHAANNASVKAGATVAQDHGKHITRLAHSRRAHTKTLRHARYTYARGRVVNIKATWVGPREWKDTAGQIYQILEPIAQPIEPLSAGTPPPV